MPEIIRFSNRLCYADTPLIPLRQYPPRRLDPLVAVHVPDGRRDGEGSDVVNEPEADALVRRVIACCRDPRYEGKTAGVICLQGHAQSRLIEAHLLRCLGAEEMQRRRLICGDPYSFQGDERDVIFLSLVAAPNAAIGALSREADQRRFNVAVSRARDQLWLFHSVTVNDLSTVDLRRRLIEHFLDPDAGHVRPVGPDWEKLEREIHAACRDRDLAPDPFDNWFELDVALALAAHGYRVLPQHEMGGKRIDLLVEGELTRLAVKCDGDVWEGAEEFQKEREWQRALERAGLRFHRLRASLFYADRQTAIARLLECLAVAGVQPTTPRRQNQIIERRDSKAGPGRPAILRFDQPAVFWASKS